MQFLPKQSKHIMKKSYKEYLNAITTFIFDVDGVKNRLEKLGIKDVFLAVRNKIECYENYLKANSIESNQVLYMGDDLPDIPVMKLVGLPSCPQDAVAEVKAISLYVSHKEGGKACVRDVIEQVLKVQEKWPTTDELSITSA